MRGRPLVLVLAAVLLCCSRPSQQQPAPVKPAQPVASVTTEQPPDVGQVMPAYAAKYLDGKPFDLGSEKGNVVLVNVWATWCQPCRYEIPVLQTLHDKYSGRGFKVIGVSIDDGGAQDVNKFLKETKITYPMVVDPDQRIASVLRTTQLPTSVLIGRDGRIVWRQARAVTPNEVASLEATVKKTLDVSR